MNLKYLKDDLSASLVVFLVAVPLCLGIAVASGAPPLAGLIAGFVGGIVVGSLSGSSLSVSGPAAGLTAIVLQAITQLETYPAFLVAVVLAGIIQFFMGVLKAGVVGYYFPNAVIRGMLAAIGLILILKQIPHALGYDADFEGDESFLQPDQQNTFSEIGRALQMVEPGAVLIAVLALLLIVFLDRPFFRRFAIFKILPAPLIAVAAATALNSYFQAYFPQWALSGNHLVHIQVSTDASNFFRQFTLPDWRALANTDVYTVAVTIALVASIESLLSVEATDKLDPQKRITPTNRELRAQGIGNVVSGLIGGLPVTAVIVRSSANVSSGGKTRLSTILHGIWIVLTLIFFAAIINKIPLAGLAAVLFVVGYKLVKPAIFLEMKEKGYDQLIPFVVTILAILFTDLLIGIGIGLAVGIFYVIRTNFRQSIRVVQHHNNFMIRLNQEVSFLNKANLLRALETIPSGASVVIDRRRAVFIDHDILEIINDFSSTAADRDIELTVMTEKQL